ncbi:MAG: phage portal protein [Rhodospirillaceae bacterium]
MSWLARLTGRTSPAPLPARVEPVLHKRSLENPSISIGDPRAYELLGGGAKTRAGALISETSAMNIVAVQCAVRILAETLASLPFVLYRRRDRGKERATELGLYRLLHDRPNPLQTALEFWEAMVAQVALWGNAGAEIERNGRGEPVGLWFVPWRRVRAGLVGGRKLYAVSVPNGPEVVLDDSQFLHIADLTFDGVVGLSRIGQARQALGLAVAAEEYGAAFFGTGGHPGVILHHPGAPSLEAQKNLVADFDAKFVGLENAHRTAILAEGMKAERFDMPLKDAQFLELRKFQIAEIARIFRVPPHMLGDLDKATFSNIEQQSLDFVIHTMRPWARRCAQRVALHLIDDPALFAEHLFDDLLKGDLASRTAAMVQQINNGLLTPNEGRAAENRDPLPGGDQAFRPLNMAPLEAPAAPPPAPAEDNPAEDPAADRAA